VSELAVQHVVDSGACLRCRRRAWLLGELDALLDYQRHRPARLGELLALPDEQLIAALAGSRRATLLARYTELPPPALALPDDGTSSCRHRRELAALVEPSAQLHGLAIAGGAGRLGSLLSAPSVAVLSGPHASAYGVEIARSLARGLAAAGVTVISALTGPLGRAAQQGPRELARGSVGVSAEGLGAEKGTLRSCVISEHLFKARPRAWSSVAAERLAVQLGCVAILVEAIDDERAMYGARLARQLGRPLAAVPGPLTNPLAGGPLTMLQTGATLVRGAAEVLELLPGPDGAGLGGAGSRAIDADAMAARGEGRAVAVERDGGAATARRAPEHLQAALAAIGTGADTPELLSRELALRRPLATLGELEVLGLVRRLPNGRWVVREPM
jgi:DNA processing protein